MMRAILGETGKGFWDSEVSGLTLTTTGTIAGNKRGKLGMGMVGWVNRVRA